MKTIASILVGTALAAGPALIAAQDPATERESLRIIKTVEPVFPWMLSQSGITEGWARIAITVDAEGRLLDALPVSFTKKPFADAALDALRSWRFVPTRLRGEPVGSQVELMFNFQAVGVVVSFDMGRYLTRLMPDAAEYRPRTLRELDRVPTPIVADPPPYSDELADKGVVGQAVVEFYIDESGTVRVPAVISADYTELGILAIAAVELWKFEPPTCRNEAVLAKVRQTFHFSR